MKKEIEGRLFSISSVGASATVWLSRALSEVPDVICFHGLWQHLDRDEMLSRLTDMTLNLNGKVVGVAHSRFSTDIREDLLDQGGRFAAMIRNPIQRLHSLFTAHYEHEKFLGIKIEADDIYEQILSRGDLHSLYNFTKGEIQHLTVVEQKFKDLAQTIVRHDLEYLKTLPEEEIIVFEKCFQDTDYLVDMCAVVTGVDHALIEEKIKPLVNVNVNKHAKEKKKLSAEEIFNLWPVTFKMLFLAELKEHGFEDALNLYKSVYSEMDFVSDYRNYSHEIKIHIQEGAEYVEKIEFIKEKDMELSRNYNLAYS